MTYNIIATGSSGNAVVINDNILIDCGITYKRLQPFIQSLKLVLLTHQHGDHFKESAIRLLAQARPGLRFGCGIWMIRSLIEAGVNAQNIDVYEFDKRYIYSNFSLECFELFHNVKNCGYKLFIKNEKVLYATDTTKIETVAKNYDLYMIEANYDDDNLQERIEKKMLAGGYIYELDVENSHMSESDAFDYLYKNAGPDSKHVFLHRHTEAGVDNG